MELPRSSLLCPQLQVPADGAVGAAGCRDPRVARAVDQGGDHMVDHHTVRYPRVAASQRVTCGLPGPAGVVALSRSRAGRRHGGHRLLRCRTRPLPSGQPNRRCRGGPTRSPGAPGGGEVGFHRRIRGRNRGPRWPRHRHPEAPRRRGRGNPRTAHGTRQRSHGSHPDHQPDQITDHHRARRGYSKHCAH